MNISDFTHAHFIGIGGIGMSALARLFLHEGIEVTGTNEQESPLTLDDLRAQGATISLDQTVLPEADLYVFSEAWRNLNPTLLAQAEATGKPVMNYFEALGMVANKYYLIAVAGTHGKTTTTAMLIDIFESAGKDPTAIVGSLRAKTKSNYRAGKSKYAIVEACEYKRDFMSLQPDVLVILNLEHEHVDFYPTHETVQSAFRDLIEQVRSGGAVVTNGKDPNIVPILVDCPVEVIDYSQFVDPTLKLKKPGLHNLMNAAAATAVALREGIPKEESKTALEQFAGTWRRFEYKGDCNGAAIIDDYGHHPTEIKATLQGARDAYPDRKITLVFQPHTYSRTKQLFSAFSLALAQADRIILLPIYAAREEPDPDVSSEMLAEAVREHNSEALFCSDFEHAAEQVRSICNENTVVLVMGAGDVTRVSELLCS